MLKESLCHRWAAAHSLLGGMLALLLLAAAPSQAKWELWTSSASEVVKVMPGDAYQGLDMRCIGSGNHLTGCLMKDLYFDTKKDTFLFFGKKISGRSGRDTDTELERRFNEKIAFLDEARKVSSFSIRWSSRSPPPAKATCRVSVPVHLRQEFPLGANSIGHLIRDNYEALMTIAMRFGLSPSYFSWVTWPRKKGNRAGYLSHVREKYNGWLSMHPAYVWEGLVSACRAGQLGSNTLSPRASKSRYILFDNVLASGVGKRWTPFGSRTKVCEKSHFKALRNLAYTLNAVPLVHASEQQRVRISFLYKGPKDKRRMVVSDDVLRAVEARFPEVDVRVYDATTQETDAQLAWLSKTSIFVANVGSPSFRMLYLPDGAQVIFVGALESEAEGTDGKLHRAVGQTFGEIDDCWQFLDYFTVLRYHVTDANDIFHTRPIRKASKYQQERDWEAVRIRDAHVRVRKEQLIKLIEKALDNLKNHRNTQVE